MQQPSDHLTEAADYLRKAAATKNSKRRMILLQQAATLIRIAEEDASKKAVHERGLG